jgi:hypothetical protein
MSLTDAIVGWTFAATLQLSSTAPTNHTRQVLEDPWKLLSTVDSDDWLGWNPAKILTDRENGSAPSAMDAVEVDRQNPSPLLDSNLRDRHGWPIYRRRKERNEMTCVSVKF